MTARLIRFVALAACLIAPLGFAARAQADATASLTVTGTVVDTSLTLTLSSNSFGFGDIDANGYVYNPGTSAAQPFAVSGMAGYGLPDGTGWFANNPIVVTISNPEMASLRFCLVSQTNVIDSSDRSRLFFPQGSPAFQAGSPAQHLFGNSAPLCSTGANATPINPGEDVDYSYYPAYLIGPTDTANSFSATVRFSISPL